MARENLTGEQKTELAAQLEWIEKAYTVVGSFWAASAIAALVGIYTRGTVKLPVFGELTFTEVGRLHSIRIYPWNPAAALPRFSPTQNSGVDRWHKAAAGSAVSEAA